MKTTTLDILLQLTAALCITGSALGCGDLADSHATPPPLASFRGTLNLAPGAAAPEGDIKVAVLWNVPTQGPEPASVDVGPCAIDRSEVPDGVPTTWEGDLDSSGYVQFRTPSAAQQIDVRSQFPSKFTLTLAEPPARELLHGPLEYFKQNSKLADGELIVYRDGNANGTLDPSTFSQQSPDRLLSASRSRLTPDTRRETPPLSIIYMDKVPVLDEHTALSEADLEYYSHEYDHFEAGYNLVNTDIELERPERLPDDAVISLELNSTPYSQRKLCSEFCQRPDWTPCPRDPRELPAAESGSLGVHETDLGSSWYKFEGERTYEFGTSCAETEGRRYFDFSRFECEGCVCRLQQCAYWVDTLPAGTEVPCRSYQAGAGVPPRHVFVN